MDMKLQRGAVAVVVLALVVGATALASRTMPFSATGVDDANIFFVYARNISAGEGFVFNHGGERVEGFTSLLWVLVCGAIIAAARNPERVLLAVNVLLVSLTIVCCLRSSIFKSDARGTTLTWTPAFVLLLLLDFRYVIWSTLTLMETALWGALLALASVLVVADARVSNTRWQLAVVTTLMVATRPEALVWVPVLCGLFYVTHARLAGRAHALSAIAPGVIAFVLAAGTLTIFRLAYFGAPLPNTYYAKVSPSLLYRIDEGSRYLAAYVTSGLLPFASVVALIVSCVHLVKVRFRDDKTLALTVLGLTGLVVPVLTGGDHFDGFRFYQPVYPIFLLALFHCARFVVPIYVAESPLRFSRQVNVAGIAAVLSIVFAVQIVDAMQFHSRPMQTEFEIAAAGRKMGRTMNVLFHGLHPLPDIGAITVGGLKDAYQGDVIDLMGLNSTRFARNGGDRVGVRGHAAFDRRTFYELRPRIIVPLVHHSEDLAMAGDRVVFVDRVLKGLLQETRFREDYQLAEVRTTKPDEGAALAAWYDRAFLESLARSGKFRIVVREPPRPE